jgi:HD-GYP domain-containing protein (c-di-GMP phosphodiesterase class II)
VDDRPDRPVVRTAEIIGGLSLATDMAMGLPLEHGLQSTVVAMRLCERLGVDQETASQTFYFCLLFYVGCNAPADVGWDVFGEDDALITHATPFRFGSRAQMARGMMRAVAPPGGTITWRTWRLVRHMPALVVGFPGVVAATCEVAEMLTKSLGLGHSVSRLFAFESERWDGKGMPDHVEADRIPLPVRISHIARDAVFQSMLGDTEFVADVITQRAGGAFDPMLARAFVDDAHEILDPDGPAPWDATLGSEPKPWSMLEGEEVDEALAAMGHFSDMAVPELVGHSGGVEQLCRAAAAAMTLDDGEARALGRAALVHDLGRAAVPVRIWEKDGPLTQGEWELVRLHAYQTERILTRSPFLADLIPLAGFHHERLDGSGYHRGVGATGLRPGARLLGAADAYGAMTEPRPHRPALSPEAASGLLVEEARAGRLAPDAVAAVLEVAGHETPPIDMPAGLTEREIQVVGLLARGLQTKQIARQLQISAKTADFHIQNAYRKMEVSTRAGATLYAMQHGLTTWDYSQ